MRRKSLVFEPGRRVTEYECEDCGETYQRVVGFISSEDRAYAIYYASCTHHDGHEAWIDVVFSRTWEEPANDHETFGCRVGPVAGTADPAASLVTGGSVFDDSALFGHQLTRAEALEHPRLKDFWGVVDHILVDDPLVRDHVYGPGAALERG